MRIMLRRGRWRIYFFRVDDEPVGGRTDIVEWITGNERQFWLSARLHYRDIFGISDFSPLDCIFEDAIGSRDHDAVVWGDVPQISEERVAVSGDNYITVLTGSRCARNVPCA